MNRSEGQWTQPELSVSAVRGLRTNQPNTSELGSHWTTDPSVASYFQRKGDGNFPYRGTSQVNAEIPISSFETNQDTLRRKGVGNTQNNEGGPMRESEVTVREGAPIKVTSIQTTGPKRRSKAVKAVEDSIEGISSWPDYQKPGDSEKLERAYDTFHRTRTRTYNPPREMRA